MRSRSLRLRGLVFQSTLSVRRATSQHFAKTRQLGISIHALRKESDLKHLSLILFRDISIHALRKESDSKQGLARQLRDISIHALRKESDSSKASKTS